jgi:hypothetical protein
LERAHRDASNATEIPEIGGGGAEIDAEQARASQKASSPLGFWLGEHVIRTWFRAALLGFPASGDHAVFCAVLC